MTLTNLFYPRSIAVIGAARSRMKVGHAILANLLSAGYRGALYPVNPHATRILGRRCYPSVSSLPRHVDCAVIAIPAAAVADALRECGKKRIRFVVIISAGFDEIGGEGSVRAKAIQSIARRYGINIVGPNCLGILNTNAHLNASFATGYPPHGGVSFISQSGAMLVSLIDWASEAKVGMSHLISIGNESGIRDVDVLEYLRTDRMTTVIGMYLEKIADSRALLRSIAKASKVKPVIILKAGSSEHSKQAIASHTGSLAGSHEVSVYFLKKAGAILVNDVEEMFNLFNFFSAVRKQQPNDIAVVTNAGGPGIIAVDILEHMKSLRLASIPPSVQKHLRTVLPPEASVANPIDLVGDADLERFKKTLVTISTIASIGSVVVIVTPQLMTPLVPLARFLVSYKKTVRKNIIVCLIGGRRLDRAFKILRQHNVLAFRFPYDALRVLELAAPWYQTRQRLLLPAPAAASNKKRTKLGKLSYEKLQRLLRREGLPFIQGSIIKNTSDISRVKHFPVAMKVLSSKIIHKARSGGIRLNVSSRREARVVAASMMRRFGKNNIEGILAQPMVSGGTELIIGIKRDPAFGSLILLGIGGSFTEQIHDVTYGVAPLSRAAATMMIGDLQNASFLEKLDMKFLSNFLIKVSRFALQYPEISELDFNPFIITHQGGMIIDARAVIAD